ncbi:MAG: T9SS type A sorting domain-containing protein [Ignavibacteria bacterium]|nr:T9SS type A sorting domain-containing protein [Ignavibacteria bacterium]
MGFAWLILLISQALYPQRRVNCELSIYGSLKIDVCGNENEKRFILVMGVGRVRQSDSLFGFNYEIQFDTSKVKITDVLYIGTLSEFFDNKSATINSKEGKINGYAISFGMIPISGDRPLVAFNGLWKTLCPDTAHFKINYIEFTDEFKVIIDSLIPTLLIGEVLPKEQRVLLVNVSDDTIKTTLNRFDFVTQVFLPKKSRVEFFEIDFFLDTTLLGFEEVTSVGPGIEVMFVEKMQNGYKAHLKLLNDTIANHSLKIKAFFIGEDKFAQIRIVPNTNLFCKCIAKLGFDSTIVFYDKPISIVEGDNKFYKIDYYDDFLISIYDLMGKLVVESSYCRLKDVNLPNGIYLIVFKNKYDNKILKMIKLVSNCLNNWRIYE